MHDQCSGNSASCLCDKHSTDRQVNAIASMLRGAEPRRNYSGERGFNWFLARDCFLVSGGSWEIRMWVRMDQLGWGWAYVAGRMI